MRILKAGEVIAELRDEPKDYESCCKQGALSLVVGDSDVKLTTYATQERACEVNQALHDAYFNGAKEFYLPEE